MSSKWPLIFIFQDMCDFEITQRLAHSGWVCHSSRMTWLEKTVMRWWVRAEVVLKWVDWTTEKWVLWQSIPITCRARVKGSGISITTAWVFQDTGWVTSGIGVGSSEACRKINVNQTVEDLIHHGQTAVMATLLQCWPLEVAQHCSDAAVDVQAVKLYPLIQC